MASKFDHFLKASWNATFSAQEPPRGASAADRRRRWSRARLVGGRFRRGTAGDRLPEPWFWKVGFGRTPEAEEDLGPTVQHVCDKENILEEQSFEI